MGAVDLMEKVGAVGMAAAAMRVAWTAPAVRLETAQEASLVGAICGIRTVCTHRTHQCWCAPR